MQFKTEVRGREVVVHVTSFDPPIKGFKSSSSHPDTWTPDYEGYAEWYLLDDFDGKELDWKLSFEEDREVEDEVFFVMMGLIKDSEEYMPEEEW